MVTHRSITDWLGEKKEKGTGGGRGSILHDESHHVITATHAESGSYNPPSWPHMAAGIAISNTHTHSYLAIQNYYLFFFFLLLLTTLDKPILWCGAVVLDYSRSICNKIILCTTDTAAAHCIYTRTYCYTTNYFPIQKAVLFCGKWTHARSICLPTYVQLKYKPMYSNSVQARTRQSYLDFFRQLNWYSLYLLSFECARRRINYSIFKSLC